MRTGRAVIIASLGATVAISGVARANPAAVVPTLGTAVVGLDYAFENDRADIERETLGGAGTDPSSPVGHANEFKFHQSTHTLLPSLDIGFARDTWLSVSMPIVIAQSRNLDYADGVTASTSSTVADGILPATGFDARSPGSGLAAPAAFQGVTRHGLDYISLGFGVAPMNQKRDDTKPTWKIGVDVRLAIGKIERLTTETSASDTGVSRGLDELHVWTSFDRRIGRLEPWVKLYYQIPFNARGNSQFQDPGFGATNVLAGQQGGAEFGVEIAAVDDHVEQHKVGIDLSSRITGHFEGRDYSEMWEVFANAGDASNPANPLVLDKDPTQAGVQALGHPGVTNIENYLELAARLAVRGELGNRVRFAAYGEAIYKTDHAITFADAGVDLPTCKSGQTSGCETDNNDVVNPGTREVNPLHVNQLDLVGHRYLSAGNLGLVFGIELQASF